MVGHYDVGPRQEKQIERPFLHSEWKPVPPGIIFRRGRQCEVVRERAQSQPAPGGMELRQNDRTRRINCVTKRPPTTQSDDFARSEIEGILPTTVLADPDSSARLIGRSGQLKERVAKFPIR